MNIIRIKVLISGKVQGVFYRSYAVQKAKALGLKGFIRNLEDGQVEAIFEGPKDKINKMIKWCLIGSPYSKVTKISKRLEISGVSGEEFKGFEIKG